ncbi:MAG: NAD-dependent epimerase/dehydratase family protein [Solirubrobacteraceae bacterium]
MRVFVAGATGAIGTPLVTRLLAAGHDVTGTTRSRGKAAALQAAGATPAVVDALDAAALRAAVLDARPDVVVHELTDLSAPLHARNYDEWLAGTNRLRTEATRTLIDAGREAGARRILVQSVSFLTAAEGPPVLDESAPLMSTGPASAAAAMEGMVQGAEGIEGLVLRYGFFYGPGTSLAPGGWQAETIRRRRLPIVGDGGGRWSLIHVDDAAAATVAALDRGGTGVLNVVDDEPAPMREWVPGLAGILGARPPRRVPVWLARLVAGPEMVLTATQARGASNARARERLGWAPQYPSWRQGFPAVFAR